ncbi:MAG: hypothetical protein CME56_05660 [Halieaceae bacterium]|nr:hypothetical protein [Halieaceae bacterium]|tara:strand:+ start:235 stop:711 length:477 start_codon:yes stop_codon:yes gene_type:complete
MAEAKTKAAPKAAEKKAAAKKTPAKAKKASAKKKPAAKTKASTKGKTRARPKAIDTGRNALLAGLGVYGKAYDQALEQFANLQEQVDEAQTRLTERRKQAEDLYKSLIKRGTAVEKEALKALADLELDSLADRSKLEAQMKKAKSRFDDLKTKFGKAA